ncbi:MAG: sigma-54-dependent Fis family transcriptional regulator [Gemmatimonadaceae bacterium]|nr:sigma-54-dependent Fis family transcriptional regulator [Gemmatimonadaceae bacterium]
MAELLIVDDEETLAHAYSRFFAGNGHAVRRAFTGASALASFRERRPDVVLLDVHLPDMSGFDVFEQLKSERPVVVMISGQAEVPMAVRAMQEGMENFLTKPVSLDHLGIAMDRALETVRLRQLRHYIGERRASTSHLALGSSPTMRDLAQRIDLLAGTERTPALLAGESGTGKGRIAELIHAGSARSSGPFVEVPCGSASVESLDAELFGTDAGSTEGRPGLVEMAAGGSLFLEEIGDVPLALQPKVLRVLEGKPVRRAGGTREVQPTARLLAATSRDLIAEVNAGRFREDLYYRLSVMPLRLPPLRERSREDLCELIDRLIEELAQQLPQSPRLLGADAIERLLRHPWPGNIRELRNVLERAMILGRGREVLDTDVLPPDMRAREAASGDDALFLPRALDDVEREHIERTLRAYRGNRSRAARILGISRATLIKKIRDYGLAGTAPGPA